MGTSAINHGTYGGYQKHRALKEVACEDCKQAHLEYMRRWNTSNMDKRRVYDKQRGPRFVETEDRRSAKLKFRYGLTSEQWEAKFDAQGRMCDACGGTEDHGRIKQWQTDHNHTTKKLRGILCARCNRLIGQLGDTAESVAASLTSFLKYLQKHDGVLAEEFKQQVVHAFLNNETVTVKEADPDRVPKPRHRPDTKLVI